MLGEEESSNYMIPYTAKITWILKNKENIEKDYAHFGPPFILSVDKVFNILKEMASKDKTIENIGKSNKYSIWVLKNKFLLVKYKL